MLPRAVSFAISTLRYHGVIGPRCTLAIRLLEISNTALIDPISRVHGGKCQFPTVALYRDTSLAQFWVKRITIPEVVVEEFLVGTRTVVERAVVSSGRLSGARAV